MRSPVWPRSSPSQLPRIGVHRCAIPRGGQHRWPADKDDVLDEDARGERLNRIVGKDRHGRSAGRSDPRRVRASPDEPSRRPPSHRSSSACCLCIDSREGGRSDGCTFSTRLGKRSRNVAVSRRMKPARQTSSTRPRRKARPPAPRRRPRARAMPVRHLARRDPRPPRALESGRAGTLETRPQSSRAVRPAATASMIAWRLEPRPEMSTPIARRCQFSTMGSGLNSRNCDPTTSRDAIFAHPPAGWRIGIALAAASIMPRRRRYEWGVRVPRLNRGARRGACSTRRRTTTPSCAPAAGGRQRPIRLLGFCAMRMHFHLLGVAGRPTSSCRDSCTGSPQRTAPVARATDTIGEARSTRDVTRRSRSKPTDTSCGSRVMSSAIRCARRLVERAEDSRWSSLWHRDVAGDAFRLTDGRSIAPADWSITSISRRRWAVLAIRRCVIRGCAVGNASWQKEVAKNLGDSRRLPAVGAAAM